MEATYTENDPSAPDITAFRASHWKRLTNYIVDGLVFYELVFLAGILLAYLRPETFDVLVPEKDTRSDLLERLVSVILYVIYMGIVETVFRGRSLGKLITGTQAVNLEGDPISASDAWARALARAVPFSVFSALGTPCNPWHDRWTNTLVIDLKEKAAAESSGYE